MRFPVNASGYAAGPTVKGAPTTGAGSPVKLARMIRIPKFLTIKETTVSLGVGQANRLINSSFRSVADPIY